MKRISVLAIVALLMSPGFARFRGYGSLRYRTRYSPYAFSPSHKSGLVCGYVRYSPYAFDRHHSGLVYDNVRWSPYAFDEKHSGLIVDYCGYGLPYPCYVPRVDHYREHSRDRDCDPSMDARYDDYNRGKPSKDNDRLSRGEARMHKLRTQQLARVEEKGSASTNPLDADRVISDYLKGRNLSFRMERVLKVGSRTVSADFVLPADRVIIKYWNPEALRSLADAAEYKQLLCEKYTRKCSKLYKAYGRAGGNVYQIKSADRQEILNQLRVVVQ